MTERGDFRERLLEATDGYIPESYLTTATRLHEEDMAALREERRQWEEAAAAEASERRQSHAREAALRERVAKLENLLDRAIAGRERHYERATAAPCPGINCLTHEALAALSPNPEEGA